MSAQASVGSRWLPREETIRMFDLHGQIVTSRTH